MTYRVILGTVARRDVAQLHGWIEQESDLIVADRSIDRLKAAMLGLADFPHRGTPRISRRRDVRTIVFERRVIIYYGVKANVVSIIRVVSGKRDQAALQVD